MRYLHTFCPMIFISECLLFEHQPCELGLEVKAALGFTSLYIGWNIFCWWVLKTPPYPMQRRVYQAGVPYVAAFYGGLVSVAVTLLLYVRWLRTARGVGLWAI